MPSEIQLIRKVLDPEAPIQTVDQVHFSRVGNQVQLDLGQIDLNDLRLALEKQTERVAAGDSEGVELDFLVTSRVILTPSGLSSLLQCAQDIRETLEKEGLLKLAPEQDKDESNA